MATRLQNQEVTEREIERLIRSLYVFDDPEKQKSAVERLEELHKQRLLDTRTMRRVCIGMFTICWINQHYISKPLLSAVVHFSSAFPEIETVTKGMAIQVLNTLPHSRQVEKAYIENLLETRFV